MALRGHYAQLVARQLESTDAPPERVIEREIVEKETIIEKIVEKEKIVGKSNQHHYDSLWANFWALLYGSYLKLYDLSDNSSA